MATHQHKPLPAFTEKEIIRFWTKIDRRGPDECWPWTSKTDKNGYGIFATYLGYDTFYYRAIRVLFLLVNGKDLAELEACHHCDNPPCCNPRHIFAGTHVENMKEIKAKGRQARGDRSGARTHPERFPRGDRHPFRLHPELVRWGEDNPMAKLTMDQVRQIRALRADGKLHRELAIMFGVSRSNIGRVVRGQLWTKSSTPPNLETQGPTTP